MQIDSKSDPFIIIVISSVPLPYVGSNHALGAIFNTPPLYTSYSNTKLAGVFLVLVIKLQRPLSSPPHLADLPIFPFFKCLNLVSSKSINLSHEVSSLS